MNTVIADFTERAGTGRVLKAINMSKRVVQVHLIFINPMR